VTHDFTDHFRSELAALVRWRRDVRSFSSSVIAPDAEAAILESLEYAPSVGLSQPWRVVRVASPEARAKVQENFHSENEAALADVAAGQAEVYARLKLAGLETAPLQLAVFCDPDPNQGHGLGRRTMPEMVHASAVCAVMQMWLVARAYGVGVGWVSILDPARLKRDLDVAESWDLVAYLCLGLPQDVSETPELERAGWDVRRPQVVEIIDR